MPRYNRRYFARMPRSVTARPVTEVLHTVRRYYDDRRTLIICNNLTHSGFRTTVIAISLNVRHFAVFEGHFHVFVDINLLSAQGDLLLWLAQSAFHLVSRHSQFDFRGLGLLLLLLRRLSLLLIAASLLSTLLSALIGLLVFVVADRKQLAKRIFHLARAGLRQRALGKLKDYLRLVVGWRIGLVARVASHNTYGYAVFGHVHFDLCRINLVPRREQMRSLFFSKTPHHRLPSDQRQSAGTMHRSAFIFCWRHLRITVRHAQNASLLNRQQGSLLDDRISTGIRSHLHQFVLCSELFLERNGLRTPTHS